MHFVVQGAIKMIRVKAWARSPLVWMGASRALPYLVFLVPRGPAARP